MVHTHLRGVPPRLSRADHEYSVQVPGILAVIIGDAGVEMDHRKWGWHLYDGGGYRRLTNQDLNERVILDDHHFVQKWQADADSVQELS